MSYLDILRRVGLGQSPQPDARIHQDKGSAPGGTKYEKRERIYWRSMDGKVRGPATLDHLHLATDAMGVERVWLCLSYRGRLVWVREDLLVSGPEGRRT